MERLEELFVRRKVYITNEHTLHVLIPKLLLLLLE